MDALGRAQDRWRRDWDQSGVHRIVQIRRTVWPIHWSETQDLRARTARDEEQRRLQAAANERTRAKALQTVTTPTRPATRPATRRNDTGQGWDRD